MAIEDIRRHENMCPACNEYGKLMEHLTGVRVCVNDSCIVKKFRDNRTEGFKTSRELLKLPNCPSCGSQAQITKHDTIHCPNPECRIDNLDMGTYIKNRDK